MTNHAPAWANWDVRFHDEPQHPEESGWEVWQGDTYIALCRTKAIAVFLTATPDLFEALEHIMDHGGIANVPDCEGCAKGNRLARAAIRKARGEA